MPPKIKGKGAPLSKVKGIKLTSNDYRIIEQEIRKALVKNIKKDMALNAGVSLVPLPNSTNFIKSFTVKATAKGVSISSTWPTANVHTSEDNPEKPYPMTWLTQPQVPYAKIQLGTGITLVRTTPSNSNLWVHPGFKRYDFIQRSINEGMESAMSKILPSKLGSLLTNHNLFK